MNVEGFTYESWYKMPVHLRTYYISVIEEKTEEQMKEMKRTTPMPQRTK
tara:strand:- start:1837 stop:1983 length:147 start_codon:yes stop_codon:yes gene_type:complete